MERIATYELGTKHLDRNLFPLASTCSFDDLKVIIQGMFSISKIEKDFRYKDEIQFQVWNQSFKIEKRAKNENWNRIELFFKPAEIEILIKELEKLINHDTKQGDPIREIN